MTLPESASSPGPEPIWIPLKSVLAHATRVSLAVAEPADVRIVVDLGFAQIVASGVDDVGDLMEGFRLRDEDRVACERYGFVLSEQGDEDERRLVIYRDKHREVRIPRTDYDRISEAVLDLLADPRVQAAFERAYTRHAAAMRGAAWSPGPERAGVSISPDRHPEMRGAWTELLRAKILST
ncbi:hypothetical protein [Methylobacterium gossipiicola]|uniref:Uncharacterized protein n=1 Tax=Methylobacterium gossipiicola TaxID=582675 RepID=A0A1I2UPW7_9HYPH|nr:hypothetical protein [Methylobacterium gossipiicola]SFG79123.1 hypothetical protein SAMN05192565_11180 [Methylobacterium gossipiicola]